MSGTESSAQCSEERATKGAQGAIEMVRALLTEGRSSDVVALVAKLVEDNVSLQRKLATLSYKRYKTSEIVDTDQLRLLLAELASTEAPADTDPDLSKADEKLRAAAGLDELESAATEEETKRKKQKRPARRAFPEKLRRVANPISVPAADRPCPQCGEERKCIGHDVTEVLEVIPAELVVRLDKREKLACVACESELCRAPAGKKVATRGRMGVQLVSCLLVEKYRDGLPLHRQIDRFNRLGVSMPVSTLVDQVKHAADRLKVLQDAAIEAVLAAHVMHLDATGVPVLDREHRKGIRLGSLWGTVGDRDVSAFMYTSTGRKRGQKPGEVGPEDFLEQREGLVVADASNLFDKSFEREELIECGCNAHGRRGFVRALDRKDGRAAMVVGAYRRLYRIEREGRDLSNEERTKLRQEQSKPVFEAILMWCKSYEPHERPTSPLGEAIRYFSNHHQALGRFLEDGAIPIDNNLLERQNVRVAMTRKNFLFLGSDEGGRRAAIVAAVLGCCALNDVDPVEYLADILPRLAGRVSTEKARDLLPDRWKLARPAD